MTSGCDVVVRNVNLAGVAGATGPYGAVEDGAVAWRDGVIEYVGPDGSVPTRNAAKIVDGRGGWLTPGLIDCHTHAVYGGNRAREFEWRLQGRSYQEIAEAGGGILSTVAATRAASATELESTACRRVLRLMAEGVTTVEIKSGYGLDTATELRMLTTAGALGDRLPLSVVTTFLGAHAVPPEYSGRADAYLDLVCEEMLPEVAESGAADAVDIFCESVGFSVGQMERLFAAARRHGLAAKGHVEQLSNAGGAVAAARAGAMSVDHLEYLDAADVPALAETGTVAVLLPGAYYSLRGTRTPPVDALRSHAVPMAVASDLNPGTSPIASLLTAMNMACVLFRLLPEEAFRGVTAHAARALGLRDRGYLAPGARADCALWEIKHPAELSYGLNLVRPARVWFRGAEREERETGRPGSDRGGTDVSAV